MELIFSQACKENISGIALLYWEKAEAKDRTLGIYNGATVTAGICRKFVSC